VVATGKLKTYKSPGIYQIPARLIWAGSRSICGEMNKLINCISDKEELLKQWNESAVVPIYKKGDKRDCSNCRCV
jgi:hypothetical protein